MNKKKEKKWNNNDGMTFKITHVCVWILQKEKKNEKKNNFCVREKIKLKTDMNLKEPCKLSFIFFSHYFFAYQRHVTTHKKKYEKKLWKKNHA